MSNFEDLHPRQSTGRFDFKSVDVSNVSLSVEDVEDDLPPALRLGAYVKPKDLDALRHHVLFAQAAYSRGEDTPYLVDGFVEKLPYLDFATAVSLESRARAEVRASRDPDPILQAALEENIANCPHGAVDPSYVRPSAEYSRGYGQGTRTVGSKATDSYQDIAITAQMVRADLKEAIKANFLPEGVTYAVTISRYSGGCSLSVTIRGLDESETENHYGEPSTGNRRDRYRPEAQELLDRVDSIVTAYESSDIDGMRDYFNTNFYGSVSFESRWAREYRLEQAEKRRAKKLASV